jgi:pimeloyl-ACP methyl ester carboxylesterase
MIQFREIGERKLACWVNDGGFRADRKTLVFIHGSGGNHTDWIRQFTPLQNMFNIAAMDLPGHGQSDGPGEQDVSPYVAWVKKLLEGFGIEKPVLIGHSLGAAICLSFAIRHGDLAAAVVPVGGGVRMPVNPIILEGLKMDPAAIIGLAAKFSIAKENRERLSGFITENLSRANPGIIYGDFFACSKLDITEAVAEIRIPALILCGADDKMTPPALSEYLRDHIPGAGLALIPGAGHFVMLENPEAFNAALANFVNALPA